MSPESFRQQLRIDLIKKGMGNGKTTRMDANKILGIAMWSYNIGLHAVGNYISVKPKDPKYRLDIEGSKEEEHY